MNHSTFLTTLFAALCIASAPPSRADDTPKPIRALMVCGGCCHDYENQKRILSEGISKRANVVWTIVHEGIPTKEDDGRKYRVSIYEKDGWANGYDVVLHNECFGFVDDNAFVERITKPHFEGLPAVVLHCSTHSYRKATTDEWRKLIGQSSFSHETRRDLDVKLLKPDHVVMKGFPAEWHDAQDELYKNEKLWPNFIPLAEAYGVDTKKDHACIWVNTYGKGKVFGTTLGHTNETMQSDVYLDLVTRGLLWATGHLNDDGTPATGFGPGGK
jgi:uncharacterized protein